MIKEKIAVAQDSRAIEFVKEKTRELVAIAVLGESPGNYRGPWAVEYAVDEDIKMLAVKACPYCIHGIKDPSEALVEEAVSRIPYTLKRLIKEGYEVTDRAFYAATNGNSGEVYLPDNLPKKFLTYKYFRGIDAKAADIAVWVHLLPDRQQVAMSKHLINDSALYVKTQPTLLDKLPKGSKELFEMAVGVNGHELQYVPYECQTEKMRVAAVMNHRAALKYIKEGDITRMIAIASTLSKTRSGHQLPGKFSNSMRAKETTRRDAIYEFMRSRQDDR